jgi:hypothetical protein
MRKRWWLWLAIYSKNITKEKGEYCLPQPHQVEVSSIIKFYIKLSLKTGFLDG